MKLRNAKKTRLEKVAGDEGVMGQGIVLDEELVISSRSDCEPGVKEEEDSEEDVSLGTDLVVDLDMGEVVASSE